MLVAASRSHGEHLLCGNVPLPQAEERSIRLVAHVLLPPLHLLLQSPRLMLDLLLFFVGCSRTPLLVVVCQHGAGR